jgi:arsenate reductase
MREIGIDISGQKSKELAKFAGQGFDYVVTVCDSARQQCPVFPGARALHWDLADPAATASDRATQLNVFRRSRDQIRELVRQFLKEASAADRPTS